MKKFLLFALALLTLASCKDKANTRETADLNQRIDSLSRVNVQKDNEINDMLETLNTIEDGFRAINEAQGRVTVERRGEGADAAQRIRENMQFINETMTQNKELINKLRLRLRDSNTASEQLRKTLENLTAQLETKESELAVLRQELEAKDIHIAELDEQVNQLNEDVTSLKDDKARKEETISQQDKELNTAWYVVEATPRQVQQRYTAKQLVRVERCGKSAPAAWQLVRHVNPIRCKRWERQGLLACSRSFAGAYW